MSWPSITLKAVDPEHGSAAAPRSWPTRENSSIVLDRLRTYVSTQAANPLAYARQEAIIGLLGWVPSLPGIALRGVGYRAILEAQGTPAIEQSVRIRFAGNVRLGRNVFIDHGVYLHACPPGIDIGDDSYLMHDSILHVFNFRDLPHAGIRLGKRCFVGERTIIRGQGGVTIGDDVLIAPLCRCSLSTTSAQPPEFQSWIRELTRGASRSLTVAGWAPARSSLTVCASAVMPWLAQAQWLLAMFPTGPSSPECPRESFAKSRTLHRLLMPVRRLPVWPARSHREAVGPPTLL
jgi:hypothetical protein